MAKLSNTQRTLISLLMTTILLGGILLTLLQIQLSITIREIQEFVSLPISQEELPEEIEKELEKQPTQEKQQLRQLMNQSLKAQSVDESDPVSREIANAQSLLNQVQQSASAVATQQVGGNMDVATQTEEIKPTTKKEGAVKTFITFHLPERDARSLPPPIFLAEKGGEITVNILVDASGRVIEAKARNGHGFSDLVVSYAEKYALKSFFSEGSKELQKGYIVYKFVAQ